MTAAHGSATQTSSPLSWWLICLGPTFGAVLFNVASRYGGTPPAAVTTSLTYVMLVVQLLVLPFLGGYTYRAGPDGLAVLLGILKIPIKRLAWSSVEKVEVLSDFRPLTEFRGYGLRTYSRTRKTGYVVTSGGAVQVSADGWTYVLAMPDPADFAAAIERWRSRIAAHPPS